MSTPFSGCVRVNPSAFGGTQNLLRNQNADNGNVGWSLFLGGGGGANFVFGLVGTGSNKLITVIGPTIPASTWTDGCFTYDGSGRAAGVKIYSAGVAASTNNYQDFLGGASFASPVALSSGAIYGTTNATPRAQFFTGSLADIHVAPGVFSPSTVATLNAATRQ